MVTLKEGARMGTALIVLAILMAVAVAAVVVRRQRA